MKYYTYEWKGKTWLTQLKENDDPLEIFEKYFMIPRIEITNLKEITKLEYDLRS